MKIINKTPHYVNVLIEQCEELIIPPDPTPVRLEEHYTQVDAVDGIPVYKKHYGAGNLPHRKETVYIVSLIVAMTYPDREDFLVVNQTVRDANGRITGDGEADKTLGF